MSEGKSAGPGRPAAPTAPAPAPPAPAAAAPPTPLERRNLLRLIAKRWVQALTLIATSIFGSTVGVLAGFSPPPAAAPAFDLVKVHPVVAITIGALLLVLTVASWRIVHEAAASGPVSPAPSGGRATSPVLLIVTTSIATVSTLMVVLLISLVLTRPSWCPNAFCPQPPGPHDQYLETQFTTLQSSYFVVDGDPAQYSLSRLPASSGFGAVGASRIDAPGQQPTPYRVVVRIHSLQQGRFGMIIEDVSLVVVNARPPPSPFRVWLKGAPLDYTANPFRAIYVGQHDGAEISAAYAGPIAEGHVQLSPGESDELAIQVRSPTPVDLKFKVGITYRIADQDQLRHFTLPYTFHVVFSDPLNWQTYTLQGGHLLPG